MTRDTMHKNNCLLRHSWNLTELQYLPTHAKDFAYDLSLWSQNCLTTIITWWIWLRCQMQGQLLQHLTVKLFLGREFMGYSTITKVTLKRSRKKRYLRKISQSTLGFWWKKWTGNSISGLEILFLIGDLDFFFCGGLLVGNMCFFCWSSGAWNMFVAPETCLFLFKKQENS